MNFLVTVISHNRPLNVTKLEKLLGMPVTWIVGKGEGKIYRLAGAENVIEGGGLCASRNAALNLAADRNAICIQVSDDLKKLQIASIENEVKRAHPIDFFAACELLVTRLCESPYLLAGVAPTPNLFYFNKPISEKLFIVGDFIAVDTHCGLYFDEYMTLKEDYDYTLQHFQKYGGALRCNDILATFQHRTNHGGACDIRTSVMEQQMILHLKEKWPNDIRDNPRRPDEILLRRLKSLPGSDS